MTESLAEEWGLIEEVCERPNLIRAYRTVKSNGGSPGVDGMIVHEMKDNYERHWKEIQEVLLAGTYLPQPVNAGVLEGGLVSPTRRDPARRPSVVTLIESSAGRPGPGSWRVEVCVSCAMRTTATSTSEANGPGNG